VPASKVTPRALVLPAADQGPGLTAQGPGLTDQGPGLTAQGPGLTAQGPGLTAQGPGLTAQGLGVTVDSLEVRTKTDTFWLMGYGSRVMIKGLEWVMDE